MITGNLDNNTPGYSTRQRLVSTEEILSFSFPIIFRGQGYQIRTNLRQAVLPGALQPSITPSTHQYHQYRQYYQYTSRAVELQTYDTPIILFFYFLDYFIFWIFYYFTILLHDSDNFASIRLSQDRNIRCGAGGDRIHRVTAVLLLLLLLLLLTRVILHT